MDSLAKYWRCVGLSIGTHDLKEIVVLLLGHDRKSLPIGQKGLSHWKNNRRMDSGTLRWSCDSLSGHHLVSLNPDRQYRHPPFIKKKHWKQLIVRSFTYQHVSAWSSHIKTTLHSHRDWANPDILSWLCLWQNCRATPQTRSPAVWTSSYPEAN